jgi:hypothetical protein
MLCYLGEYGLFLSITRTLSLLNLIYFKKRSLQTVQQFKLKEGCSLHQIKSKYTKCFFLFKPLFYENLARKIGSAVHARSPVISNATFKFVIGCLDYLKISLAKLIFLQLLPVFCVAH